MTTHTDVANVDDIIVCREKNHSYRILSKYELSMTSLYGNVFRIYDPLWEESTRY